MDVGCLEVEVLVSRDSELAYLLRSLIKLSLSSSTSSSSSSHS